MVCKQLRGVVKQIFDPTVHSILYAEWRKGNTMVDRQPLLLRYDAIKHWSTKQAGKEINPNSFSLHRSQLARKSAFFKTIHHYLQTNLNFTKTHKGRQWNKSLIISKERNYQIARSIPNETTFSGNKGKLPFFTAKETNKKCINQNNNNIHSLF